ncbi:jg10333 [Pararge aegeria aegeria]|uniref:Jg10333 protein n=1 Tax=Pararge aegeria aegeria TaxID=348720 RepID=A0A8S4RMC2_9NEOP|nr:jg10333 [Pararge aegeria aegeria]
MSSVNDGELWISIQNYDVSNRTQSYKVLQNIKNEHHEVSYKNIHTDIVVNNGKNKRRHKVRSKKTYQHAEVSSNGRTYTKEKKNKLKKRSYNSTFNVIKKKKKKRRNHHNVSSSVKKIQLHEDSTSSRTDTVIKDNEKKVRKHNEDGSINITKKILQYEVSNRRTDTEINERKNKLGITKWRRETRWRMYALFIPLVFLNIIGLTDAESLTSRVLASFLGYPTTCNIGVEVRPCTLSLSCWLRGGTRVRGCGSGWLFSCCLPPEPERNDFDNTVLASFLGYPTTCNIGVEVRPCTLSLSCWLRGGTRVRGCGSGWLFSCCLPPEPERNDFDNTIPSSDWRFKVVPPKLRQVPQRSVVPTNVFRRRVDEDISQMECGLPSTRILQKRIIGGREARFAEFPWQAHVRISEFQCGGVLISKWFVATAAHCVSRARPRDIAVWLGALDTTAGLNTARKLGVVQKILHPLFQFRMTQPDRYDIALLKLTRPITYTTHILPICLPDSDIELRGKSGVIAGWGKTDASNGHTGTNLLRSATVPILSTEQCINWHQSKQILVEIHSEMICAGHSDGHQDACLGDSGGPLIVLDSGRYYLVGITSAGFGCGVDHQPGIYHNVKITANWIKDVISPAANFIDF